MSSGTLGMSESSQAHATLIGDRDDMSQGPTPMVNLAALTTSLSSTSTGTDADPGGGTRTERADARS
eukprot:6217205-Pyramimonas_sp.AAC.1